MAVNRRILNPLRLPFRHPGTVFPQGENYYAILFGKSVKIF